MELEDVSLNRRGNSLVRGLNITVKAGEALAVMGPSGAGKTTLLRTIAGLSEPCAGQVRRQSDRVAMVFQDPRLLPWRTAIANVEVVMAPGRRNVARELLARVGLGDAADVYPAALSGGMRQRVAIARTLAYDSPLLLVDEPLSNLDADTAQQVRDVLLDHHRATAQTLIWVTQDPLEAELLARQTLMLQGPPDGSWEILHHEPSAILDAGARQ